MILVDAHLLVYSADNDFKRFARVRHINLLVDGPR
jgi:hypothetical protein